MSLYSDKLARILRVDKTAFAEFEKNMDEKTGKAGTIERIVSENDSIVSSRLADLGLDRTADAKVVYGALAAKIEEDDRKLFDLIGMDTLMGEEAAKKICSFTTKAMPPQTGFFLKHEKAEEFLRNTPPKNIISNLGYSSVDELLEKEDLLEVFSALRFLEDSEWLNNVFFKQYEALQPSDFEERQIEVRALGQKWAAVAEKFVAKKYHNVSHLKELGVIFVIPIFMEIPGETMRLISLLMHYLNEVKYYSDLFVGFSTENDFSARLISLLRGDVAEERSLINQSDFGSGKFLVVQRYLAKGDEHDWRLFVPHVNPEAVHWSRAEDGIVDIPKHFPELKDNLEFWKGLDWIGDHFRTESGVEILVSFNLVDTVMSLVMKKEMIKYLYHHQEALWNKIFISYFDHDRMMKEMKENIVRGWFQV